MLKRAFTIIAIAIGVLALSIATADAGNLRVRSGAAVRLSNSASLDLNESGGTATGATIEAGGEIDAGNGSINVTGNLSNAGTFTAGTSTVTLDGTAAQSITSNSATYNDFVVTNSSGAGVTFADAFSTTDFTAITANTNLTFDGASTYTITGTLDLNGQASGTEITLRSDAASAYTFDVQGGPQTVNYVDVQYCHASSNDITANNSINSGNNDDLLGSPHWVFASATATITSPSGAKTVGTTPTVKGTATPGAAVTIRDNGGTAVANTTADANGNFRVTVTTPLAVGANSLTPYIGAAAGTTVNITVVNSPTTVQVPTITSPTGGSTVNGSTPTISGQGNPGQAATLTVHDANGNLLLTDVGASTVDGSGNYTISSANYSTALVKGTNYLSVTVDGVTSSIINVTLTDPFGVVFDSITDTPIVGATVTLYYDNDPGPGRVWIQAVPGVHIAAGDANPQVTGAGGSYSYLTINGDFYLDVSAAGYTYPSTRSSFPAGRSVVTGSKQEPFTVAGAVLNIDLPMDGAGASILKVTKDANKRETKTGDIVTYTVKIQNPGSTAYSSVFIEDKIPAGFKYITGKTTLDGVPVLDPTGNRPLRFNIGNVNAGQTYVLKYQLVVGSGVTFGNYENEAFAKYSSGAIISNIASETVKVAPNPVFYLGTVIGKVFWDKNENGIQDEGEGPIPFVEVATEDGTLITTDQDGKFHLPALTVGRHLFRIDERSLPEGAYLTTNKIVVVDITEGVLVKVNFGVNFEIDTSGELPVKIQHDRGKPTPRLNVSLFRDKLIYVDEVLSEPAQFRIFTNYAAFIKKWKLEILETGKNKVVKNFSGGADSIHQPIYWDGKLKNGKVPRKIKDYAYRVMVYGVHNKKDSTKPVRIDIKWYDSEESSMQEKDEKGRENEHKRWIKKESVKDNLKSQRILVDGETVKVLCTDSNIKQVTITQGGKLRQDVLVVEATGPVAQDVLERKEKTKTYQEVEIILPNGEYKVDVYDKELDIEKQNTKKKRERRRRGKVEPAYSKTVKVGDDYFFLVAMGDAKMGYTFHSGHIDAIRHDDSFREGFWSEGKLAYYLKGKIKGKYLITSSLDTERDKKELFRKIDPDKYYPVYGDASSTNYDATNTQGMFYALIEWDKSYAKWGNYDTDFSDTEFAKFKRTIYGGKVHYESLANTKFGKPSTKLVVFQAKAEQRAAHNEFLGTGGSLFYLKHKDAIEGSEKVKIEVRDKTTGLVLDEKEMQEGSDYEIDYPEGRMIFWKPVSRIIESESIISSQLLDGNPVYVVVDYEYETKDKYDEATFGVRTQKALTDYVTLGGTYVREEQPDKNYELKGVDATIHIGKDIKVSAEYAQSESEEVNNFISTDGGLSFTELPTADSDKGKAYGLKGEAKLFKGLKLRGYYKRVEPGFSSTSTISQQGKELIGGEASLKLSPRTHLKIKHDIQALIDDGNIQTQLQTGAKKVATSRAQITHKLKRWIFTAEYRHQEVEEEKEQFESQTNREDDTVALKAKYKATSNLSISVEQQATIKGDVNHQTTIGIDAKVNDSLSINAKEIIGTEGNASKIGITTNLNDNLKIHGDYTHSHGADKDREASISATGRFDEDTELYTTFGVNDSSKKGKTQSVVFGSKRKIDNEFTVKSEQNYAKNTDAFIRSETYGLAREKEGRTLEATFTSKHSQEEDETSDTNIFGLSGDINEKWASFLNYEKGIVQNHDGTQTKRHAGSMGLAFVDKDPDADRIKTKASTKLEVRLDDGQEDKKQFLGSFAAEKSLDINTTLFAKAQASLTKNTTTDATEAEYKEFVLGLAYRPIYFDKLNLLAKYNYLEDRSPESQEDISDIEEENMHTVALEAVYDLTDRFQLVEKFAYKTGKEKVTGFDFTRASSWLAIHRLNYNFNRDWQAGLEYRRLMQDEADDCKQGALFELSRKIGEYAQVGVGYNFTDFNDDLTHLDYTSHGPFFRITATIYEPSPEEIERAKKKKLEAKIRKWTKMFANNSLAVSGSETSQELHEYFYQARQLDKERNFEAAKDLYQKIVTKGEEIYEEAEGYVRGCLEKGEELDTLKKVKKVRDYPYNLDKLIKMSEKSIKRIDRKL
ncbi:MAG: DUF11 domain-containing protein [Candidatus Omnitrophota bacterium]|nr:MAG: DUF11 domain-containing protein [Candidatus Omnitrophota bacterium]